jgi:serine/threonine protein kinase/tetratricopeptide (TPR) repeat protein
VEIGSFLESGAVPLDATIDEPITERPGTIIGPYRLMEQIGEGGMGLVFVAEQQHPVRRKVALKVIKPGMDTGQVVARFEAERQALALMDHPNIAQVHDGGTAPSGRPYFVMELVKGAPITEFCDQNQIPVRERLELFLDVCQAVQHAHQKGIIHRDIKPTNVLVVSQDGKPVVKVIDFGVAKAIGQQLTDKTIYTQFTQMIGTPLYMSPEQAGESGLDIDTRTDVYALGVLLYEFLTGTTPFEGARFKSHGYDEIRRIIREEEPPKPSTRVSTLGQAATTISAQRKSDPKRLSQLYRGELDWIVMKALEKDRNRRYESASAFAADVQRYLHSEPVQAYPPSRWYLFSKFVRRNRGPVAAAGLVFLVLVLGIVGTTLGLLRALAAEGDANNQRVIAEGQREEARAAERKEQEANQRLQQRLRQIEKGAQFMVSIFETLDPRAEEKGGLPLSAQLGERLNQATKELDGEAIGDPLSMALVQGWLGCALRVLGYPEKAIVLQSRVREICQREFGPDHPQTLVSVHNLALAYKDAGKLDEAISLLKQVLEKRKTAFGPDDGVMNDLAEAYLEAGEIDKALPLLEQMLEMRKAKFAPDHPFILVTMQNLAGAYLYAKQLNKALLLAMETVEKSKAALGPDHFRTLDDVNLLACVFVELGQRDKAIALFIETVDKWKAKLGPDHPATLLTMNNLANAYSDAGQLDKGILLAELTLEKMKAKCGPDHPNTLSCMRNLGRAYLDADQLDKAIPIQEVALEKLKARLGPNSYHTAKCMSYLAESYYEAGQLDKATPLQEQALAKLKAKLGPDHPETLSSMSRLALAYQAAGRFDLAISLQEQALEKLKAKLGPDNPLTLQCMYHSAATLVVAGNLNKGIPLLEQTLEKQNATLGPDNPNTITSMSALAAAYRLAGQFDKAIPMLEQALEKDKFKFGPDSRTALVSLSQLAMAYQAAGQLEKAIPMQEQAVGKMKTKLGPNHRFTLMAMGGLAQAYQAAGQLDKAISLHEQTLEKLKANCGPEHPTTLQRMNNLATAYWAAKKLDRSIPLFETTLSLMQKVLGPDHLETLRAQANLGVNYRDAGRLTEAVRLLGDALLGSRRLPERAAAPLAWIPGELIAVYELTGEFAKAEPFYREFLTQATKQFGADDLRTGAQIAQLAFNLLQQRKFDEAQPLLRDCLALREKKQPDDWTTFNTRSMLGACLVGQKKYADAEPLLLAGYDGMKKRQDKIPPQGTIRLGEAKDRLVQLYEAWGKPQKAAEWRAR